MTIPEVRERLLELARELDIDELAYLAEQLKRRPAVKKARPSSAAMTDELREKIRAVAALQPGVSNRTIGNFFNVDSGRVSEALAGFRE